MECGAFDDIYNRIIVGLQGFTKRGKNTATADSRAHIALQDSIMNRPSKKAAHNTLDLGMKTLIRALIPKRLRPAFRTPYNYVQNKLYFTRLFRHHVSMIPPLELTHDGPVGFEEFKTSGEEFLR
jgi:hypothetical protein